MKNKLFIALFFTFNFFGVIKAQLKVGQNYKGGVIAVLNPDGKSGLLVHQPDYTFKDMNNWTNARASCEKLGPGWRLPTSEELIAMHKVSGAITLQKYAMYWSNDEKLPNSAAYLNAIRGTIEIMDKTKVNDVRAVRSFPSGAELKLGQEYLGGLVVLLNDDLLSGLIIQKNDMPTLMNWNKAMSECSKLGAGWRLPSRDELRSIHWSNILQLKNTYWSITKGNSHSAFICKLGIPLAANGNVVVIDENHSVRAVRSFPDVGTTNTSSNTSSSTTSSTSFPSSNTSNSPAANNNSNGNATQLKIGQEYLGGLIVILNNDGKSGLIIQKNDVPTLMNWNDAMLEGSKLGEGWRLPSRDELRDIHNNNVLQLKNNYWSITKANSHHAYICELGIGYKNSGHANGKFVDIFEKYSVRVVRPF